MLCLVFTIVKKEAEVVLRLLLKCDSCDSATSGFAPNMKFAQLTKNTLTKQSQHIFAKTVGTLQV